MAYTHRFRGSVTSSDFGGLSTYVGKVRTSAVEGPVVWRALHESAKEFRGEPKVFKRIAEMLVGKVLQCPECKPKGVNYIRMCPIGGDPVMWACKFHNWVNLDLGKTCQPCPEARSIRRGRIVLGGTYVD